jgi:cytochrome P450
VTLLERFTTTVELSTFEAIRGTLFNPNVSRTFDTRDYAHGNIRDGVVSIAHGPTHRARRRVENTQFRPDKLRLYERELFPIVMDDLLDVVITGDDVDLFPIGEMLACVLAARRAGVDIDERDIDELHRVVRFVDAFSQGSAILDARDPEAVRQLVYETYVEFERDYVRPAWARRLALLDRVAAGEMAAADLSQDILTVLLQHRGEAALELADDGRVVREVATYLQGGTHTSGQVMTHAIDLLFAASADDPTILDRAAGDLLFCQRVVHETLRLRPTTPKIRRRVMADTVIAGRPVPADSLVLLDAVRGNRDPSIFGPTADRFDPDREVPDGVPRWGLSFGAGAHQCPGRTVAGGFPVPDDFMAGDEHLFGLVALMVQEVVRRGIAPHPTRTPELDTRTDRTSRWAHYWVAIGPARGPRRR